MPVILHVVGTECQLVLQSCGGNEDVVTAAVPPCPVEVGNDIGGNFPGSLLNFKDVAHLEKLPEASFLSSGVFGFQSTQNFDDSDTGNKDSAVQLFIIFERLHHIRVAFQIIGKNVGVNQDFRRDDKGALLVVEEGFHPVHALLVTLAAAFHHLVHQRIPIEGCFL